MNDGLAILVGIYLFLMALVGGLGVVAIFLLKLAQWMGLTC